MSITDRIYLAVDFSDASRVAARAAFRFAEMVGAKKMTMLHSVQSVVVPPRDQQKVRERCEALRRRIHEAAEKQLEALCAELDVPEGLELVHHIVEGRPAEAIPAAAAKMQASLLLVGTHSRKGVRRWVKGSIAESMLRRTRVPTLVLLTGDDGVPPEAELEKLSHVLIAVDLGEGSDVVVDTGLELAASFERKRPAVSVVHTVEAGGIEVLAADDPDVSAYEEALAEAGRGELEALVARTDHRGLVVDSALLEGDPDEAILQAARKRSARLIVVGTHGRGLAHLLEIGSTTAHVVRGSDVAVLVVPSHPDRSAAHAPAEA